MPAIVRFFLIVGLWHPAVAGGLVGVVVIAGILLVAGRIEAREALPPVLLLQTLAVSSGFAGPARRGHYDFLFAAGHKRVWIATVHWAISAAPGVAAWSALVLIDLLSSGSAAMNSVAGGPLTGLLLASTVPWAVTVPLPRLTGGLIWILLLATRIPAALTVPPLAAAVAAAATMAAAVMWIERADFPLETAQ